MLLKSRQTLVRESPVRTPFFYLFSCLYKFVSIIPTASFILCSYLECLLVKPCLLVQNLHLKCQEKTVDLPEELEIEFKWSDEICMTKGQRRCVWLKIPESDVRGHLVNFANFWFTTESIRPKEILTVIRNVLPLIPVGKTNKLLLQDVLDLAVEKAKTPPAVETGKIVLKEPTVHRLGPKDKAAVLSFHNWIKQHLLRLNAADKETLKTAGYNFEYKVASERLRTVFGFCALILMRLMVKKDSQIGKCFPNYVTKTFHSLFPKVGLTVAIVAPSPKCIELVSATVSHDSPTRAKAVNVMYLLMIQYIKSSNKDEKSAQRTRRILEEGCLNILEENGMGLLQMFQGVKKIYSNVEERQLLSLIPENKRDIKSSKILMKFLDTSFQQGKKQYSWKWARIFSPGDFIYMNIRRNLSLCSKFAALQIEKNPSIFEHESLKTGNVFAQPSLKWAKSARIKLQELDQALAQGHHPNNHD